MRRRAMRRGAVGPARRPARRAVRRTSRRRRRRRRRRILIGGAVLVAGGAMVYKLTKKDSEKVEQYTGKPVDELSDEEMQKAMNDLGIQNQELSAEDQAAIAADSGTEDDYDEGDEGDYLDEIERLAELRDKGIITDDEFEAKKKDLLGL